MTEPTTAAAGQPTHQPTGLTYQIRFGVIPNQLLAEHDLYALAGREPRGWWIVGAEPGDFYESQPYRLEPADGADPAGGVIYRAHQMQRVAAAYFEHVASSKLKQTVKVTRWAAGETLPGLDFTIAYTAQMIVEAHSLELVFTGGGADLALCDLTQYQAGAILDAFENGIPVVNWTRPKQVRASGSIDRTSHINLRLVERIDHVVDISDLDPARLVGTD